MKAKVLLAEAVIALFLIVGFRLASENSGRVTVSMGRPNVRGIMGCSPDWSALDADSLGLSMRPLPGWGNYKWPITTTSDSASFYFNQGINMYYAFHIIEAMASFKKAETFDDKNPMIHWGQALAYGPNINDFAYATVPDAIAAAQMALRLSGTATRREKGLIDAMLLRYSQDTTISRKDLNQSYADGMKKIYQQFSKDADVAALYADALMLQHPWEYWQHSGAAHPWTPEIINVLESILSEQPGHPGANHYYIHMVEASPDPGRALPSADRLGKMMPDVSHMVHMPSHIYIRTGNYAKGMQVNDRSLKGYENYKQIYPEVVNNAFLYSIHNYHMKAACAMMRPNYKVSLEAANACAKSFDTSFLSMPQPLGNFIQYVFMTPQMVNVRYGKWSSILAAPEISRSYHFAFLLDQWARGMAHANSGQMPAAKNALARLANALEDNSLTIRLEPFNMPYDQAVVAQKILEGTIAAKENKLDQAIRIFADAVVAEDKLIYTEPRDWLIPSRHYLAHVLMQKKSYAYAKKVLLEDLKINPRNFYVLRGLEAVADKQGNAQERLSYKKQLQLAFRESDLGSPALVY